MPTKGQTHAKRARELELKERRERKRAKKAERAAGNVPAADGSSTPEAEGQEGSDTTEWIR